MDWVGLIITVAVLALIAFGFILYACCVSAGRADERAKRMLAEALKDKPAVWDPREFVPRPQSAEDFYAVRATEESTPACMHYVSILGRLGVCENCGTHLTYENWPKHDRAEGEGVVAQTLAHLRAIGAECDQAAEDERIERWKTVARIRANLRAMAAERDANEVAPFDHDQAAEDERTHQRAVGEGLGLV